MYSAVHDLIEMTLYTHASTYMCSSFYFHYFFQICVYHCLLQSLCLDLCMPMSVQKLHGINSTTHTLPGVSVQTTLFKKEMINVNEETQHLNCN